MSSYYASKAYVLNLTYSIASELKKNDSGISISCLCPGPTHTPFMEKVGIKFEIPAYKSSFVAKYAIDKMLKGKTVIIPGIKIKILMGIVKLLPKKLISSVLYKIQKQIKKEQTIENQENKTNKENV
jgi:short-subunit dehydrogenase